MSDDLKNGLMCHLKYDTPWERAVVEFFNACYTWGSRIPRSWFYSVMDIPEKHQCKTPDEYERAQLEFLNQFDRLRQHLLIEHKMLLKNVRGEGCYEIVKPEKQTSVAMQDFSDEFKRLARKTATSLANVERKQLSDKQWADNQQKIAQLAFFRRTTRKQLQ